MAEQLSIGDEFPDITLETAEGRVSLQERWEQGPLVVAFERHFG
jgi:peroxiredoxin